MKAKNKHLFWLFDKKYYTPPSKRKWSKQNDKYKTRRPLAESFNMHKINIKGEYWKQKHVNKQFVVENGNQDMINERTSLNFFGYPNISLHNKLGGSLYIEQMDQITLCIMMYKCIKENIYESYIWKILLERCTKIAHKMTGSVLSYIFKYGSQCDFYNHYFFITMLGNISSNLYSLNITNCSNILYAMNTNNNYYNEEIYNKLIDHCSLLILNRNDININSILHLINSFYYFDNKHSRNSENCSYLNEETSFNHINNAYHLFACISKTYQKYDIDLCEIDLLCSNLLVFCYLNKINLFFQEKILNIIHTDINYLNDNIDKLNIKHLSILCYAACIFKHMQDLHWTEIYNKIEKDCYLLNINYLNFLFFALKNKLKNKKNIYRIIYENILNSVNNSSIENISLLAYSFLRCTNNSNIYDNINKQNETYKNNNETGTQTWKGIDTNEIVLKKEPKELKFNYSFHLFNDFLFGKIKYNIGKITIYHIYLLFKELYKNNLNNDKTKQLKLDLIKEIKKKIYFIPVYLLASICKIMTDHSIKNDNELISLLTNISFIYLNVYKHISIYDNEYQINDNSSLIEDYYNTVSSSTSNDSSGNSSGKSSGNDTKSDITFLYGEKKKEIRLLSSKYLIHTNIFKTQFNYLNKNFDITKDQIENTFNFSKNYFFNYYLKEKQLSYFVYFCKLLDDKKKSYVYFNKIKEIIQNKIIQKEITFTAKSILYIFKTLNHFDILKTDNNFFNLLLKQLCDQLYHIKIETFYDILTLFYQNKIAHYYFLKKARYIINMNRYELNKTSLEDIKNMVTYLFKTL
ncbi:conserved protein, unknown function [Hepatocystis sp. ex Piliocolobus tephrosceles]|nr:conserved protein, unknown function [Hepatocystis sp. ex Piliocolobus tephrosceles]